MAGPQDASNGKTRRRGPRLGWARRLLVLAVATGAVAGIGAGTGGGGLALAQTPASSVGLPAESPRRVMGAEEQAAYGAVGRVQNVNGGRHCTGTLIAPDLVLTAAHCVAKQSTGWVAPAYRMIFQPAFRNGRSDAARIGQALAIGEGYMDGGDIAADVALIRLKSPIAPDHARALSLGEGSLLRGRGLSVYSYGYDAPDVLAMEQDCRSLAKMGEVMVTSCEAVGGVSGAPVLARDDNGQPVVTAVVSSRLARAGGQPGYGRAVVVPVDQARLAKLKSRLSPAP